MKKILLFILLLPVFHIYSQDKSLKEKAIEFFEQGKYDQSINLLKSALKGTSNDPEIYYYLGLSTQQKNYANRSRFEDKTVSSEQIFYYLDKAIELDSTYGDAKYFYGVECSENAFNSMKNGDIEQVKYFYQKAYDRGAYPDWLIEYGYNVLISCDEDAILFAAGNVDYDVCSYLQFVKGYRPDLTIIPLKNIDSPWYIQFLKEGLEGGVKPVNISLTDEQITALHPVKWKTTEVSIYYDRAYQRGLRFSADHKMKWSIEPDMDSNKNYVGTEAGSKRQYLSPQRAMLLQIVQDNYDKRKIFFSNACEPFYMAGLNLYVRNRGLVGELLPIKTAGTTILNDYSEMAKLLTKANLHHYKDVKKSDIPQISDVLYLYHNSIITLAGYYRLIKDETELRNLMKTYTECLRGVNKEDDKYYPTVLKIKYTNKK